MVKSLLTNSEELSIYRSGFVIIAHKYWKQQNSDPALCFVPAGHNHSYRRFHLLRTMCNLLRGKRPNYLGVKDGQLARPNPKKPNNVSSQADPSDLEHYVEPLRFDSAKYKPAQVVKELLTLIDGLNVSTKMVQCNEVDYLYVEFTSKLMGYVDDVEFYVTKDGTIHVRSASRLGYSDLGANRARIKLIRSKWNGSSPSARL
jgi:uncharacterized protein (DUF1499 family)